MTVTTLAALIALVRTTIDALPGFHVAVEAFDVQRLPDSTSDRAFMVLPATVSPLATSGDEIEWSVTVQITVAYIPQGGEQQDEVENRIASDLDAIVRALVPLEEFNQSAGSRIEAGLESADLSQLIVLTVNCPLAFCGPR